jgi:outer membrane protein, heavy metal efflux system
MRVLPVLIALASCVPSPATLRAPVDHLLGERLGASLAPPLALQTARQIDALLERPLDTTTAIRIALANSSRLRAAFDELDLAAGDVAAALGLGPLTIDAQLRLGGAHDEYELDAIQNVLGLIAMPRRAAAARAELAAARAAAAAAALRLAARVEIAFDDLLAAQQAVELRQTAFDAADAAAAVRERMHAAGNTTELAQARDRDAREAARVELGRAEAAVELRREAVNALLGLSGERTRWATAGALRELPVAPPMLDAIEAGAVAASLELTAGRERREAAENRAAGERLHALLPELGVGVSVANDGHQTTIGPALRIGIPLLDPRTGERARADAVVRREEHALEAQAIELRAVARAARIAVLATYQEARHLHDVVLPLRQLIVSETLKHYNAMDADPFALIVARRELVDGAHQYLEALRRYWNAIAEVTALARGVMLDAPGPAPTEDHR